MVHVEAAAHQHGRPPYDTPFIFGFDHLAGKNPDGSFKLSIQFLAAAASS